MINKFEFKRKLLHILVGILFILIVIYFPHAKLFLFIVLLAGIITSTLSTKIKIPLITNCICTFERKQNQNFPGKSVLFFFAGSLLSLFLFEKNIALASITILTFADPISHLIGFNFGKIKIKNKNLEGAIAGALCGSLAALFFVPFYLSFIASIIYFAIDLIEIKIDDNLLIPIITGAIMQLLASIL